MDIKISCPSCNQHISAAPAMRGQLIHCPGCGTSLKVPEKSQRPSLVRRVTGKKIGLVVLLVAMAGIAGGVGLYLHAGLKRAEAERFAEARAERKAAAAATVPPRPPTWSSNALYMAARGGDVETMKKILDAQPDRLNELSGGMRATMLNIAAYKGQKDVVDELLRRGAKLNIQTKQGHTPVYDCILGEGGTPEILQSLLDAGADASIADNTGKTPLQLAVELNKPQMAEVLKRNPVKK